jgi:hypothetical protein
MVDIYAAGSKTKLMSCCRMMMIVIVLFFLGLSMVGTISVAAGSISSSHQIGEGGGKELQGGVRPQQRPQLCGSSGSSGSGVTDGTNATTPATGIAGANNTAGTTTSLYENPEIGIQILCPENWIYREEENPFTGEFQVFFTSLIELQQSERIGESPPTVGVATREVPIANLDLQRFADLNIENLMSEGYEIISTNFNTTLTGMPAFEVVYVDANRTIYLQDWTIQGDRAYAVVYVNHEPRFQQFLPIAQDMISSFTITDDNTSTTNTPLTGDDNNGSATTVPNTTIQTQIPSEESPSTITSPPTTTDGGNTSAMTLEAARQQYLAAWNQTEFQIVFNTYIEPGSATGYGMYEERENNNIFRPGETIQLYAEPVGFGHQPIIDDAGNTLYSIDLAADIIISDVNGNELATIEDLPISDIVSHRQNTELHLTLTLTQDGPFPVGDYIVSYIVYDQVKGESFQMDNRITIDTEEDDDNAGTANTTTVQERQRQQQLQPEQVEWLQYENATYGVRMLYPSDWLQTGGAAGEDGRFVTVSNFYSPEETDWAYVFMAIDNMPTSLESSLNDTINAYNQDPLRDFQVLSSSLNNFTLAGTRAYTLEATYSDAELGQQYLLVVETIVDGRGYGIQYIASPQTYQQYFPIAERMIESFETTQQLQQEEGERQQQQSQQEQGTPQQNQEDSFTAVPGLF